MNENVILLGNGINRLGKEAGPSWSQLLSNLQSEINSVVDINNDFKPFPMAFEEMLMTNCTDYVQRLKHFKKTISKTFIETTPNDIHKKILLTNSVKNILTTNYDYALEKALVPNFSNQDLRQTNFVTKEIKYSLRRRNSILDNVNKIEKNIWHIHGELYDPKNYHDEKKHFKEESILIGYEHYSEALKVMQDYKNGRNKWAKTPLKQKLLDSVDLGSSWMDYFFSGKLFIIGLDLSFSEIDIWWLLNFRARWLKELGAKENIPSSIKGEIFFLFPTFSSKVIGNVAKDLKIKQEKVIRDIERNRARAEVLQAFEVITEEIAAKDYDDFYQKFINRHL